MGSAAIRIGGDDDLWARQAPTPPWMSQIIT
jgi:hypothetical protein